MSNINISCTIISRGRALLLKQTIMSIYDKAKFPEKIETFIKIDDDDIEAIDLFQKDEKIKKYPNIRLFRGRRSGWCNIYRVLSIFFTMVRGDIIVPLADDIRLKYLHWDEEILKYKGKVGIFGQKCRFFFTKEALKRFEWLRSWTGKTKDADSNVWKLSTNKKKFYKVERYLDLIKTRDLTKKQRGSFFEWSPLIEIHNWQNKNAIGWLNMEQSRNIYLEVGALNLYKIDAFLETHNKDEWIFHLFEPNPVSIEFLKAQLEQRQLPFVRLWEVAIGICDEERKFYPGHRRVGHAGATMFKGKEKYVDYDNPIIVQTIDFDRWIKDHIDKQDYVYMNMDVEGSEYEVLPKMIENGSLDYINKAEIEFHCRKFRGETKQQFEKIHNELKQFFINKKNADFALYSL